MQLIINVEDLSNLTIAQYAFLWVKLYLPYEDPFKLVGVTDEITDELRFTGYLDTDHNLTDKFTKTFNIKLRQQLNTDVEKFVEQYRAIFPEGRNSVGYPYRGDKQGCLKKMSRFLKQYPKYSKDLIIMATKDYVSTYFLKGYNYMQTAAYFIEKDGVSNLAGLCEQLKSKSSYKSNSPSGNINLEEDLN